MKWMNRWTIAALLLICLPLRAEDAPKLKLTVEVTSFHITHVNRDSIEAEVGLAVDTGIDATIEHIAFSNIHANDVPFFARPIDATINLRHDQQTALPPISVVVYYNDLDSLEPITEILEHRLTHLKGEIAFTVHANRIERLFLHTATPRVVAPVDRSIEVEVPAGELERHSAIALLRVAQVGLSGGKTLEQTLNRIGSQWRPQMDAARDGLLHAQSCYSVVQKKVPSAVCLDQLAFVLPQQQIITSAELGAPWKYDPITARYLAHGGAHLESASTNIALSPGVGTSAGETGPHPLTAANFQIAGAATPLKEIVLPDHSETTVFERSSPGLYARMDLQTPSHGSFQLAPQAVRSQSQWDQIAVYRLVRTSDGGSKAILIVLSGTVKEGLITFSRSVDRSAIGSPILTPSGVIGMVQSETAGTLLPQ